MGNMTCNPNDKKCPYWSKNNGHDCRMTKGGLYIPMPEHIDLFCSTPHYIKCHQYMRGCELLQETAKKYGFIVDGGRRRFRRVSERISLAVSLCDNDRRAIELLDDQAMTLDLSLGGLRIESHREISPNTLVAFEFGPDFSAPELIGIGEVKWCESKNGSGLFETGIAFSDFSLTQAIGNHLGLPMM
jgi:hypothetical protein